MIPLGLKIIYTLFVCALAPIYWRKYGPANFLWFSDIALLVLVPALWLESALLVSMMAVSVVLLEAVWNADFFSGWRPRFLIGLSVYVRSRNSVVHSRPVLFSHRPAVALIWGVHRLGYDRRAFFWQTILALVVLPFSYLVSNPQENVIGFMVSARNRKASARTAFYDFLYVAAPDRDLSAKSPSSRHVFRPPGF